MLRRRCLRALALGGLAGVALGAVEAKAGSLVADGGALWLHRNLGAAYFRADRFGEAARELARAAELPSAGAVDVRNAGIAALLAGDLAAAREALQAAEAAEAADPSTAYARGILEKRSGRIAEATRALERCAELGARSPELAYNRGLLAARLGDLASAERHFREVVATGPDRAPHHYAPALSRQGRALLALGRREEGEALLSLARAVARDSRGSPPPPDVDLDRGPLLGLTEIPAPPLLRAAGSLPVYALESLGETAIRWAECADTDGDGDRDLLLGDGQTLRDLRREGDDWIDVTSSRGLAGILGVGTARILDVDGDGEADLVRGGGGGIQFHPGVAAAWDPPLLVGREPVTRFVPVDYDQEGDLDFVAAGPRRPSLFQNLGDRTFLDVSDASGLSGIGPTVAVAAVDLDDDGDVDLVFVTRRGEVVLAVHAGEGRFSVRPAIPGAPAAAFDVAAGDLDADGDVDLAVAAPRGVFRLENRGGGDFDAERDPALPGTVRWPAAGATSVWIADLDSDGRADVLAAGETGGLLGLGSDDPELLLSSELLAPLAEAGAFPVAVALVDADTRLDLITSRGTSGLARNIGPAGEGAVLRLVGTDSNRDGIGAVVEGTLDATRLRREAPGGPVHLGLGDARTVGALRVRWPTGLSQTVPDLRPGPETVVVEDAAEDGSCPFLFAWNGERFEFVADVLTGARLGLAAGPGAYAAADSGETVRIPGDAWRPDRDGFLTLQLTEEHREVVYLDRVEVIALDHPDSVEVRPSRGTWRAAAAARDGYVVLDGARPPVRAVDGAGRDVTDALDEIDDVVAGGPSPASDPPFPATHVLELDFGAVPRDTPLVLHLAGWQQRAGSSRRLAAAQRPGAARIPLQIKVAGPGATWLPWSREAEPPGGTTRSVAIDLTGAFPEGRARLRIVTTLRLFWDQALLQIGTSPVTPRLTAAHPDSADLHPRGRSEPILPTSRDGPIRFDHGVLRRTDVPWHPFAGNVTRTGDVTPLLEESDDLFVILAPGDECTIRFRADVVPPLASGESRSWFVVLDGWVKDGDPNTAFARRVDPLPFHGMSGYPCRPDERYPDDEAHRAYFAEWNVRSAAAGLVEGAAPPSDSAAGP